MKLTEILLFCTLMFVGHYAIKYKAKLDEYNNINMKKCNRCNNFKPKSDFHFTRTTDDNLVRTCKICISKYSKSRIKKSAFIYIITNPAWNGWVKIGRANDVLKRLKSYNTSSPLRDYQIYYFIYVDNITELERTFNEKYHKISNGEWYNMDKEKAKKEIISIIKNKKLNN